MISVKDIMSVGKDNPIGDESSCFRDVLETMDIRGMWRRTWSAATTVSEGNIH